MPIITKPKLTSWTTIADETWNSDIQSLAGAINRADWEDEGAEAPALVKPLIEAIVVEVPDEDERAAVLEAISYADDPLEGLRSFREALKEELDDLDVDERRAEVSRQCANFKATWRILFDALGDTELDTLFGF